MPIRSSDPFFWRHNEGEIILLAVRWYLRLPLSYRHVATGTGWASVQIRLCR